LDTKGVLTFHLHGTPQPILIQADSMGAATAEEFYQRMSEQFLRDGRWYIRHYGNDAELIVIREEAISYISVQFYAARKAVPSPVIQEQSSLPSTSPARIPTPYNRPQQ
jgi:hypothetical protein